MSGNQIFCSVAAFFKIVILVVFVFGLLVAPHCVRLFIIALDMYWNEFCFRSLAFSARYMIKKIILYKYRMG